MFRPSPSRASKGFSFLELATAMGVLAVLLSLGFVTFSAVRNSADGFGRGSVLVSAQLELRRLATDDGSFPSDPVASLNTLPGQDIVFVSGAASGEEVSVVVHDGFTAVLATRAAQHCRVLVDRPAGSSTWVVFTDQAETCSASALSSPARLLPAGGTVDYPQEVDLNG